TGPTWRTAPGSASSRGLAILATVVTLLLYGQIVLGALATHAGWALTHVGGAVFATGAGAGLAGAALAVRDAGLGGVRFGLRGLRGLRGALGLGASRARSTEVALPGGEAAGLGFAVAHRVGGAGLLGASVALTLRAWRAGLPAATAAGRVDPGLVTTRIPA